MNDLHVAQLVAACTGVVVGICLTLAGVALRASLRQLHLNRCLRDGKIIKGTRP